VVALASLPRPELRLSAVASLRNVYTVAALAFILMILAL
jgi:hypothetical protein